MIYIKPAVKFKQLTDKFNINLLHLQYILTTILNKYAPNTINKDYVLHIICRKCVKNYGLYEFNKRRLVICTSVDNKQQLLETLLHEFRHWIQHTIDKIEPVAIISKGIKYEDNAYENQCEIFETISPKIEQLLNIYEDIFGIF